MENSIRFCLSCRKEISGRKDKKYCDSYCRSIFHHENSRGQEKSFYQKIDKQLKTNRKLLRQFNKAGKSTIRFDRLKENGFNPNYFTHYWKNRKGDVYLFCFEYGFLKKKENGIPKYILITWQSYMEHS